jgi:hypothetical protein
LPHAAPPAPTLAPSHRGMPPTWLLLWLTAIGVCPNPPLPRLPHAVLCLKQPRWLPLWPQATREQKYPHLFPPSSRSGYMPLGHAKALPC